MRSRLLAILVAAAAALLACGGGDPQSAASGLTERADPGADLNQAQGAQASAGAPASCAALSGLPAQEGNLVGWLDSAPIAPSGSEGFKEPTDSNLEAFQSAFEQLLEAGPGAATQVAFAAVNYELIAFRNEDGRPFIVVQEKEPRTGGGTFVLNPQPARDLWLEAPHADSDVGTLHQAASELVALGARGLSITGANRCADARPTGCDGQSAMCGGQLRISDAAHFDGTFFTAAHKAMRKVYPNMTAVSIHGMETAGAEAAVISDGTSTDNSSSKSLAFRDALNRRLGPTAPHKAFSCNDPADAGKYRKLCGTTNVQGRFDNGSANACTTGSTAAQNRFLHIEQDAALRSGMGEDRTGEALAEVVACSLGGPGLGCSGTPVACP